jgi:putative transposase
VQQLDKELEKFAQRHLEEPYPYVILDARYEKVREDAVVRSQAVLIAIGINWEGRRCVLGVELEGALIGLEAPGAPRSRVRGQ